MSNMELGVQLIGVYIIDCNEKIKKNLKSGWYPFGHFNDCHDIFNADGVANSEKYKKLQDSITKNQNFCNGLYSANCNIPITINCIVGKNGSGKSSLVGIIYRIINNLSCRIKKHLKTYNSDYNPTWASGFNAELYYELDGEIYCIAVQNSDDFNIRTSGIPEDCDDKVCLLSKNGDVFKAFYDNEDRLLEKIGEHFFYTIGTNYSLYSNSVVMDDWDEEEEQWLGNIFHKNDGYFTPVVLVPYKSEGATIDTKKELSLAKERVSTLSLLIYAQTGKDFIENLVPDRISYELIPTYIKNDEGKEIGYENKISNKLIRTIDEYYENHEKENPLDTIENNKVIGKDISSLNELQNYIKSICEMKYFSNEVEYRNIIKDENLFKTIKDNTLVYLSYKIIKICLYYDVYKNEFPEEFGKDVLRVFRNDCERCKNVIKNIIENLFTENFPLNFTNLKIKQCIAFLDNLDFYMGKNVRVKQSGKTYKISVPKDFLTFLGEKENYPGKQGLTYDYVFENLLPPYFKKQFYFKKKNASEDSNNTNITISSLSSGESQLLNSMSYSVYHIKNALSSKIKYKNINLVFDEAELYYHPEYQRAFIKDLLGLIGRSNLAEVKGINITIITHSPFILSDIPNKNILCLKDGNPDIGTLSRTLGANFYDLLKNQFFMDSSIGAVTESIVNEILMDYNKIQCDDKNLITEVDKENIREKYRIINDNSMIVDKTNNFYSLFTDYLADDYLKKTLKNLIGIIQGESFIDRRRKELEEKLSALEARSSGVDNAQN